MIPKGKQDYVRRITERAKEFMESSRKRKRKKKRVENERARERKREGGSGIKWKVKKKKEKKGEDVLRNHNLKIIPQYFHNKF